MTERRIRILIAEDSTTVRLFVERALATTGRPIDVVAVTDGEEAVKLLMRSRFDIAFLDINMPQFSGVHVLAAIRDQNHDTFCVSMSDRLDEATEQKLKAFGAYDFLKKPFTQTRIQQIVEMWELIRTRFDVLVVDDSATVRRIVAKVISRSIFDLAITEAGDGEAAIRAIEEKPFRLIFSDFNMPGMNGVELAGHIGRIARASDVILMSTEYSTAIDEAARKVGACAFLRKPFYPEDVDSILHHVFGLPHPLFSKQVRLFAMT